ncbi:hypothetical protein CspeluHIS016_0200810 [Cutaneotrichosporon spelunceum]|uniref:Uncharacterized protein n=1 Tax=Cutaneotrichosporon spelunceum TaxID=1672016 RepID=A0AAD3Y9I8_9TREE|nr:hypothetical protein CspeluHIS016_0200810 [Cutaneotrichosporon spelunceum]
MPRLHYRAALIALTATLSLILITISYTREALRDVAILPKWPKRNFPTIRAGRTILFETAVHDEVIGALGHSLSQVDVRLTYASRFRFHFDRVLRDILPYEPEVFSENHFDQVREWIKNDEIDNLILTSCHEGLLEFQEDILTSTANVVCIVHHGGGNFANNLKHLLTVLVERGQIRIVVLAHHVKQTVKDEVQFWADDEDNRFWDRLKIEIFVPGFIYPKHKEFNKVAPFPHKAVIQGNLEQARRDYSKIFRSLNASLHADASLWGYAMNSDGVFEANTAEPFELHLVGQRIKETPVVIPDTLQHIITVDENLSYPEYYNLIAEADLLIPAFSNRGTLWDTASSTIAAAIITRTPVLVSERHLRAYTYIKGPAGIERTVSEGDIGALERLRRTGDPRSRPEKLRREWDDYEDKIQHENAKMWTRVLMEKKDRALWGKW